MNPRLGGVLLPLFLFLCGAPLHAAPASADTDLVKSVPCAACHQQVVKDHLQSRHGVLSDSRTPGKNCASCHGEVLRHMANPMKEKPQFTFRRDARGFMDEASLAASNGVCTSCHKGGGQKNWAHSVHERSQVGCVTCHSPTRRTWR